MSETGWLEAVHHGEAKLAVGSDLRWGDFIDLASVAAGSGGFVIHGEDAGDQSGNSVALAGDIGADGFDNLIIGAIGGEGAENQMPGARDC